LIWINFALLRQIAHIAADLAQAGENKKAAATKCGSGTCQTMARRG
jgi:hypothetical protein